MKYKIMLFTIAVISVLLVIGCQPSQETEQPKGDSKPAEVLLFNAESFPKEMVGVWENEEYGWIFRFEENGRLSKIQHTFARAGLEAGKTATYPLMEGGKGVIVPGPWQVRYDGNLRDLAVEIILESYDYETAGSVIRGSSRDIFMGKLPEEGDNYWKADWVSIPKYIVTTADNIFQDHELPIEEGVVENGEIVFVKIDPKALTTEQNK